MGNKYEVSVWACYGGEFYEYKSIYRGEWLMVAIWQAFLLKHQGHPCVKIEWR